MKNETVIDDIGRKTSEEKAPRAWVHLHCACGLEINAEFRRGSFRFDWTCPDVECGRVYEMEYVGRRRDPGLRLAASGAKA